MIHRKARESPILTILPPHLLPFLFRHRCTGGRSRLRTYLTMRRPQHIHFSLLLNRFSLHLMVLPFSIPIPLILLLTHSLTSL